ncbi:glycosyltransferase family 2 protein [Durotheca rogersii]|uniref:glycosyltransferase family 2 protein n=1 Tax=Durotheca rogersii TaxID=419775 RepID=UPI00221F2A06|nr:glycosyltransferase family 2 protein [Durotheca rogersii]KAI5864927.1 glycosyltransferase family 2 protein [Durotheca rogersii]
MGLLDVTAVMGFTDPARLLENLLRIIWPLILALLHVWDHLDRRRTARLANRYRPFAVPPAEEARYRTSDVSLVVPTVDWDPDELVRNVLSWVASAPREVIFVTTRSAAPRLRAVLLGAPEVREAAWASATDFYVVTTQRPNKRLQLCRGFNVATGRILALVDDDATWTTPQVLTNLLAPLNAADGDDVALVGGPIGSYVPSARRDAKVITAWEAAALRIRSRRAPGMRAFFVADGSTNFTVSGLTMLLRGEVARDSYFQYLFMNDQWNGVPQKTGDDGFITRYVLFQHHLPHHQHRPAKPTGGDPPKRWRLAMQLVPDALVLTSLIADSRSAAQSKLWYRTGLRLRLTCLLFEPGFWCMRSTAPYMTRKMAAGLLQPLFTLVWAVAWWQTLRVLPILAWGTLLCGLWAWTVSLSDFLREHPYCWRKLWAVMLADRVTLISDWYSWLTLSTESWGNRSSVAGAEAPAEDVPEDPGARDDAIVAVCRRNLAEYAVRK